MKNYQYTIRPICLYSNTATTIIRYIIMANNVELCDIFSFIIQFKSQKRTYVCQKFCIVLKFINN